MTLKLNYTDKQRVWDAITAPTNEQELATLLTDTVNDRYGISNRRIFEFIELELPAPSKQSRVAYIRFDIDTRGVQRWHVQFWLADYSGVCVKCRAVHTRRAKFYGKMHLNAIIDAVLASAPTVFEE